MVSALPIRQGVMIRVRSSSDASHLFYCRVIPITVETCLHVALLNFEILIQCFGEGRDLIHLEISLFLVDELPRQARDVGIVLSRYLDLAEGNLEIFDDIIDMFDAYRNTNQVGFYTAGSLFLFTQLLMGSRGRVNDQRFGITNIGQVTGNFYVFDKSAG